jgi:hypothetical protein
MRVRTLIISTAMLALAPLLAAQAEPQILALITTDGAKPLNCADGECFAEFTSFCMEPGRKSPSHDSAYVPAAGADLTLVATAADGRAIRLPLPKQAVFVSQRGFAAVRISLPAAAIAGLGASRVAIAVGPRTALLPVPMENHWRPHEPSEVAAALGPNRAIGERIVDNGGRTADGARLLSYLINGLPEGGRVGPAIRRSIWQTATAAAPAGVVDSGKRYAKQSYQRCLATLEDDRRFGLRACLQRAHDMALWKLTRRYWLSVGPQS